MSNRLMSKVVGGILSALAAASLGGITLVSFMIVFPGLGLGWAIFAGVIGGAIEYDVYREGTAKGFKNFFTLGSWREALEKQIIREHFNYSANPTDVATVKDQLKVFLESKSDEELQAGSEEVSELNEFRFSKSDLKNSYRRSLKINEFIGAFLTKPNSLIIAALKQHKVFAGEAEASILFKQFDEKVALRVKLFNLLNDENFLSKRGFSETQLKGKVGLSELIQRLSKLESPERQKILKDFSQNELALLELISDGLKDKFLAKRWAWRIFWLSFTTVIALGTGVGFAAISFTHVASAALAFIGAGALSAAAPFGVLTIAGFLAAAGGLTYGLLMYHTLRKAVESNFFYRCKEKMSEIFFYRGWAKLSTQQKAAYVLRVVLGVVIAATVIALSTVVTLGTAGAWSNSAIQFFSLIGTRSLEVIPYYATLLGTALVFGFYFPVTVLFASENSLKSAAEFASKAMGRLRVAASEINTALSIRFQSENLLQFINPFRLLTGILDLAGTMTLLAFHSVASGVVTGEGSDIIASPTHTIPDTVQTGLSAGSEFATDLPFVEGHEHEHHHAHGPRRVDDLGKGNGEGHGHSHDGITTLFMKVLVLVVAKLPAWLWDSGFSKLGGQAWVSWKDYQNFYKDGQARPQLKKNTGGMGKVRGPADGSLGLLSKNTVTSLSSLKIPVETSAPAPANR